MRIRWTDPAVRDFTQICDYIRKHGGAATARRVAQSIYERIGILTKFPECDVPAGNQ
jgi:plasmid stabilization system protein ParE